MFTGYTWMRKLDVEGWVLEIHSILGFQVIFVFTKWQYKGEES